MSADISISLLIASATAARTAHAEKGAAFGQIVRRFQDMAFACAYAVLGDFYLAEDAAQEAFIIAWRSLDQLRKPEAFPGWFKRIVLSQCNRLTRGKQFELAPLDAVAELAADPVMEPAVAFDRRERQRRVLAAIGQLPEHERLVTTMYYIGDYSTAEIAATVAMFNEALESFVAKVKQDRYVIAAILFGSLSHDTVWKKSDIDIMLVGREDASGRAVRHFDLIENGVNIHAILYPRSKFKQVLEGTLQGAMMHSSFALSTLLFTTDETIRAYYEDARSIGAHDVQMRLITAGQSALYTLAKAEKWLYTRKDTAYSFLWVMYTVQYLAAIEVLLKGEVTSREVIPQALKINPAFFSRIYLDLINQPKTEAVIQGALDAINAYIDAHLHELFGPILDYLSAEGGTRTTSELDTYFKKQVQEQTLSTVYEWLAYKGVIQMTPSPVRFNPRSQVTVDEAAYYYDDVNSPAR